MSARRNPARSAIRSLYSRPVSGRSVVSPTHAVAPYAVNHRDGVRRWRRYSQISGSPMATLRLKVVFNLDQSVDICGQKRVDGSGRRSPRRVLLNRSTNSDQTAPAPRQLAQALAKSCAFKFAAILLRSIHGAPRAPPSFPRRACPRNGVGRESNTPRT